MRVFANCAMRHRLPSYNDRFHQVLVRLFTLTYHGPLRHYTIEPIEALARHQDNIGRVRTLLHHFKVQKEDELASVKKGVSPGAGNDGNLSKSLTVSRYTLVGTCSWRRHWRVFLDVGIDFLLVSSTILVYEPLVLDIRSRELQPAAHA
jgi:hypothetical protein